MSGAVWRHRKFLSRDVLLVIGYTCNTDLSAGKFFTSRQTPTRFIWVSFFDYRQNGRKIFPRKAGTVLFTAIARVWRWKLRSSNSSERRVLLYSAICVCMWTDVHSTVMIRFGARRSSKWFLTEINEAMFGPAHPWGEYQALAVISCPNSHFSYI